MIEVWKRSLSAPDYLVSSSGKIVRDTPGKGAKPFKQIKPYVPSDGRPTVTLRVDGKTKTLRICRLVAEAFHGPCPGSEYECCHNDGNPANNDALNLRWDTSAGNKSDMAVHGTRRSGEKHHNARLTLEQVTEIRRRVAAGETQRAVGADYGMAQAHVSRIVRGVRWR